MMFEHGSMDDHQLVAFKEDKKSGLKAIIAVHNTTLGPSLGGCRVYPYASDNDALSDVLRLSRGMTYKSAIARVPLGGGKSVIIADRDDVGKPEMMRVMGDFVESLGGLYIAAEDSGTSVADIKTMGERTQHIAGVMDGSEHGGDPSPHTAFGVFCAIKDSVAYKLGKSSLADVSVAVQGVGSVGLHLIKLLLDAGAVVYCADTSPRNLKSAQSLGASVVSPAEILTLEVDVLSPCAMGAVLNPKSIADLKAKIVAGGANNQLENASDGELLRQAGIVYAPDFLVNAGGIIDIYYQLSEGSSDKTRSHIEGLSETLLEIFRRSEQEQRPTQDVAESMAEEILTQGLGNKRRVVETPETDFALASSTG